MKKTRIGVFDSGVGGVTVLKECIRENPNFEYLYYSDSIHNPYGDKTKEEVLDITSEIVSYLIKEGCSIIVIACNTASAIAVDYLRQSYPSIIFVAIEPAIKCAYDSLEDNVLIMATKGTMDSDKFNTLYAKYHRDNFYLKSCVGLANLIENGDKDKIRSYLKDNISEYKEKVNSVVLGCTHYPLIKNEIREVLGNVTFYDGSIGVSKQLSNIINDNCYIGDNYKKVTFFDSSCDIMKEKKFFSVLEDFYE